MPDDHYLSGYIPCSLIDSTDILKECTDSIFRVKRVNEETGMKVQQAGFLLGLHFNLLDGRQYLLLKCWWSFARLHYTTSQKVVTTVYILCEVVFVSHNLTNLLEVNSS
jgi:hypothetical protein